VHQSNGLLPRARLQGADCNTPRACAVAYPCAVRQGLLFVQPTALPNVLSSDWGAAAAAVDTSDIPIVEELEQGQGWIASVSAGPGLDRVGECRARAGSGR
jgi:hypothetical protein